MPCIIAWFSTLRRLKFFFIPHNLILVMENFRKFSQAESFPSGNLRVQSFLTRAMRYDGDNSPKIHRRSQGGGVLVLKHPLRSHSKREQLAHVEEMLNSITA
jgi:hypothetical protein